MEVTDEMRRKRHAYGETRDAIADALAPGMRALDRVKALERRVTALEARLAKELERRSR